MAEQHKFEENYFDSCHKATTTSPKVQGVFHHQHTDRAPLQDKTMKEALESPEEDTGSVPINYDTEQDDCLPTIPEEEEEDPVDQDTLVFEEEIDQSDNECFDTAVDTV